MGHTSEHSEPNRVGIEIRRAPEQSWRDVVLHYANLKNMATPCIIMYDNLLEEGFCEPWAALRTLDLHGCTDVIIGQHHIDMAQIRRTLT